MIELELEREKCLTGRMRELEDSRAMSGDEAWRYLVRLPCQAGYGRHGVACPFSLGKANPFLRSRGSRCVTTQE